VLTLLPRNTQNNFAALVVVYVALRLGLATPSQATLKQSYSQSKSNFTAEAWIFHTEKSKQCASIVAP
jgi:hypothetical protein